MMSKVIFLLPLQWCAQSLKLQQQEVSQCKVTWLGSCVGNVTDSDMLTEMGGSFMHHSAKYKKALLAEEGISLPALATKDMADCRTVTCELVLAQRTKVNMLIVGTPTGSDKAPDTTDWTEKRQAQFIGPVFSKVFLWVREFDAGTYVFKGNKGLYLFEPQASGSGKAGGDPHVKNIKGERFNIMRVGDAPLVSITSEGAPHLEVMALIEGVKKCQKKMFITRVNSTGSWLEKNVAVTVGDLTDNRAFSVMVDGQEVWSPASQGYQPSTTENVVFHTDRFSINEMLAKATSANQPGIELKMAHDVKMKIMRPVHRPTAPPHLNFDIQGLRNLPLSFKLGGLLGQDDHSYWSTRDADCAANFVEQAAEETEGSRTSAN